MPIHIPNDGLPDNPNILISSPHLNFGERVPGKSRSTDRGGARGSLRPSAEGTLSFQRHRPLQTRCSRSTSWASLPWERLQHRLTPHCGLCRSPLAAARAGRGLWGPRGRSSRPRRLLPAAWRRRPLTRVRSGGHAAAGSGKHSPNELTCLKGAGEGDRAAPAAPRSSQRAPPAGGQHRPAARGRRRAAHPQGPSGRHRHRSRPGRAGPRALRGSGPRGRSRGSPRARSHHWPIPAQPARGPAEPSGWPAALPPRAAGARTRRRPRLDSLVPASPSARGAARAPAANAERVPPAAPPRWAGPLRRARP